MQRIGGVADTGIRKLYYGRIRVISTSTGVSVQANRLPGNPYMEWVFS